MRFVAAIVSFVVAFCLIGLGIAQRTVFAEPDRITSEVAVGSAAPITIVDGTALNSRDGRQKIDVGSRSGDEVFVAYGRTGDVVAWAGDTSYNLITYDEETGELTSTLERGTSAEAPNPAGSDLWLAEYPSDQAKEFTVNVPEDISLIILTDGVKPAPATVSVTWPLDNRAPWSGPLIVGGVLFLLLGLGLYLWALAHLRRMRGPRRKPPTQPKLPRKPRYNYRKATKAIRRAKPKAIENPRGRRSAGRMTAIIPAVLISAIVLSGCTAEDWPDFVTGASQNSPTPAPTPEAAKGEILQTPAVTVSQLEGIVARIADVAGKADADRDAELAETRFTGAALQLRQANYAIRKVDNSIDPLPAIPASPVAVTLPQQSDTWPRMVFTVISEEEPASATTPAPDSTESASAAPTEDAAVPEEATVIPTGLVLVQETPRDNFKIAYAVVLEANTQFPDVAGAAVGAVRHNPDNKMLKLPPGELASAYADVMQLGSKSEFFELFDFESDALMPSVGIEAKAARAKKLSTTKLGYASVAGIGEPIGMATSDSGGIVAVNVGEVESAKPKEKGAILSPAAGTKALSKITKTTKGVSATYSYQLLFYVPPSSSADPIVLLGFSEGLVAAKEL